LKNKKKNRRQNRRLKPPNIIGRRKKTRGEGWGQPRFFPAGGGKKKKPVRGTDVLVKREMGGDEVRVSLGGR